VEVGGNTRLQTRHDFPPTLARFVRITVQTDGAPPAQPGGLARILECWVMAAESER
jgi:hypothetical protein